MKLLLAIALVAFVSADFTQLQSKLALVSSAADSFSVEFSMTNPTTETVSVPLHLTPLNGITEDIFEISGPAPVEYTGMIARRYADELMTVRAGETFSAIVDLSFDYAFVKPGFYSVIWRFGSSEASVFEVTNAMGDRRANATAEFAPNNFANCNANERTQVLAADVTATTDCRNSYTCLNGNSCATRYVTWFGARTDARYATTTRNFLAVRNEFNNGNYRISCNPSSCPANTYAFVYPTDRTHVVYLCSVFWRLPNERAETLTHEISHFNDVASTRDYAYGQTACKNLARSNPGNAVANADNVCYFSKGYTF